MKPVNDATITIRIRVNWSVSEVELQKRELDESAPGYAAVSLSGRFDDWGRSSKTGWTMIKFKSSYETVTDHVVTSNGLSIRQLYAVIRIWWTVNCPFESK